MQNIHRILIALTTAAMLAGADRASAQWRAVSGYLDRAGGNSHGETDQHADGMAISSDFHAYART